MAWEELVSEIRRDKVSGVVEMANKACEALKRGLAETEATRPEELMNELIDLGRKLITAQPSMSPIFNLVNSVLLCCEGVENVWEVKRRAVEVAKDFARRMERSVESVAIRANELIPDTAVILTHSYSSTVLMALTKARQAGKEVEVLCTESRPMREGVGLSLRLSAKRIKVTLVTDTAAPQLTAKANVVLMGADSICGTGLVNKTGTYPIALAAKENRVPFYSLASTDKFLPVVYASEPFFEEREQEEILEEPLPYVHVSSIYFETTPFNLLSGIVTEDGVLDIERAKCKLMEMKVHTALL